MNIDEHGASVGVKIQCRQQTYKWRNHGMLHMFQLTGSPILSGKLPFILHLPRLGTCDGAPTIDGGMN